MKAGILFFCFCVTSVDLIGSGVTSGEVTGDGITVHVAPNSAERRDGSRLRPFSTVYEAQKAVREIRAENPDRKVTVFFAGGTYAVLEPLVFEAQDSGSPGAPVVWRGQPDGSTRFSGARELKGWKVRDDGKWEVPVPTDKLNGAATPLWFEQLFVNGKRAKRARHPNSGFLPVKSAQTQRLFGDVEEAKLTGNKNDLKPLSASSPASWRYAHLVVHHKWDTTRRVIRAFDPAGGTITTEGASLPKWNSWNRASMYYVENIPAALDERGEWLYDGRGKKILYIPLPGQTPENTEFLYPQPALVSLVKIKGDLEKNALVHDIRFENIIFEHTDSPRRLYFNGIKGVPTSHEGDFGTVGPSEWPPCQAASHTGAAILADGAHRIMFKNCEVTRVGEYGIWLREGCVSNRIEHCAVVDLGAGGIKIGLPGATQKIGPGERVKTLSTPNGTGWNTIDNSIISQGGRLHASAVGVWIGSSPFNSVTHCEISDFFYTGVSIGWVWGYRGSLAQGNTLSFCRIRKIGQRALSDMGGVYLLGTSYGTCVTNNIVHAVDSGTYGGWGLYPDEGSEGILFENNLVYDTKDSSFHQHYGKDNIVRNNIFAFSRQCQIALSRAEKHLSFTAERNIIFWNNGPTFAKYNGTLKETGKIKWIGNFWWKTSKAPVFNGKTFAQWQAKGNDVDGMVVDPHFTDPEKRNFTLKPDSPVIKAGFRPFDLSAVGVYGEKSWKELADKMYP